MPEHQRSTRGRIPSMAKLDHIAEPLRKLAVPTDSLTLDPANARTHSPKNLAAIKASLTRFGQRLPIVVQREGMIVRAGNGRVMAARELGWTHIAAVVCDDENIDAVAFAIADNRSAELADWDDAALAALLDELPAETVADLGFDDDDLAALAGDDSDAAFDPVGFDDQGRLDEKSPVKCPHCGAEFVP